MYYNTAGMPRCVKSYTYIHAHNAIDSLGIFNSIQPRKSPHCLPRCFDITRNSDYVRESSSPFEKHLRRRWRNAYNVISSVCTRVLGFFWIFQNTEHISLDKTWRWVVQDNYFLRSNDSVNLLLHWKSIEDDAYYGQNKLYKSLRVMLSKVY